MKQLDLAGSWQLSEPGGGPESGPSPGRLIEDPMGIPGRLPGCTYLDLMAAGLIPDPFWGRNEDEARKAADRDFEYSRTFSLDREDLEEERLDLVIFGLDTLARITINGREAGRGDNVFRLWRFDVKDLVREGENDIAIFFENPYPVMRERQAARPMVSVAATKGIAHIRKVQSHFGWDWGPRLPPAGVSGAIVLESYEGRIEDCLIRQEHQEGAVTLLTAIRFCGPKAGRGKPPVPYSLEYSLEGPEGPVGGGTLPLEGEGGTREIKFDIRVEKPRLWWCNGLGEQPLYRFKAAVTRKEETGSRIVDTVEKSLGLRTIALDRTPDGRGAAYRFVINGVPIFARGADWIPSDSFVTRSTARDIRFYIESAKWANMNMLRVWGGGYYESDEFYRACDENGILVWQDFCFACSSYPFDDLPFLENLRQEVIDNVRRLRHHPSLALWCGNNENEILNALWKRKKDLYESNTRFYYDTLAAWVEELDGERPYWPGSPSSGERGRKANDLNFGDAHLWQIWHGLMPIEHFRKLSARFCSEFGLESFPSTRALTLFTGDPDPVITDPVMMSHQKSLGGNQKILFYLLAKYHAPKNFKAMVYLSQLVQAGAIAFATDHWRRNMAFCGGALYWQYNDCWPTASWAGIDYAKQYKALHYQARHFNKPVSLSNDYYRNRAEIYLANDLPRDFEGVLKWELTDFYGSLINSGECPVKVSGSSARKILCLVYREILKGKRENSAALGLTLRRNGGTERPEGGMDKGEIVDRRNYLLVPDKFAKLPRPRIGVSCAIEGERARITLSSDVYARHVFVEIEGVGAALSDNFFDIGSGEERLITVPLPPEINEDAAAFTRRVQVWSLADLEHSGGLVPDSLRRFAMYFQPVNLITWLLFKFI
jgi:beta-mannosidase